MLGALFFTGRRAAASWFAGVEIGGTLLNLILKQIFAAPRHDLLPHLDIVHSYSFPSGHAAGNMMFFGALAMLAGRRWAYGAGGAMIALIGDVAHEGRLEARLSAGQRQDRERPGEAGARGRLVSRHVAFALND